ncbi:uncharacterized protein MELLADRAFT_103080 [Melampsora larici-populina 98AG31]|uniref:Uncharacterized protein n=1 Tax=Melampsora larici-populina (strain 98AG31 / pathotype 3-4-7) TaxID=747676 RepID=F4RAH2_MELLP|nr:uncharacterized protein MELLADRAFT_103080 [Melampsora larici-populina 98AG31]EGG10780.1 hypothetical protein MELLADRAFT_103080 [Melampsora larici-populina 98AG31]
MIAGNIISQRDYLRLGVNDHEYPGVNDDNRVSSEQYAILHEEWSAGVNKSYRVWVKENGDLMKTYHLAIPGESTEMFPRDNEQALSVLKSMALPVTRGVIMYSIFDVSKIFSPRRLCGSPQAETTVTTTVDAVTFHEWSLTLLPDRSVHFFVDEQGFFNLSGRFLPLDDHPQPILYYDAHSAGEVHDSSIGERLLEWQPPPDQGFIASYGLQPPGAILTQLLCNRTVDIVLLRLSTYSTGLWFVGVEEANCSMKWSSKSRGGSVGSVSQLTNGASWIRDLWRYLSPQRQNRIRLKPAPDAASADDVETLEGDEQSEEEPLDTTCKRPLAKLPGGNDAGFAGCWIILVMRNPRISGQAVKTGNTSEVPRKTHPRMGRRQGFLSD